MAADHRQVLLGIKTFIQLIAYLRDELGWPISKDSFDDVDDLFYEFSAEELGIDPKTAAKIQEIKRLRPLSAKQPWGIFFVKFEPKKLPVVVLRRILSQVAIKKRSSANSSERTAWAADDLLFISNYGEGEERQISFAHFSQPSSSMDLPTLRVLGWNNLDTPLHLDSIANELTENLKWPEDDGDLNQWKKSWSKAFKLGHNEVINTAKDLSIHLAELASNIRKRIKLSLSIESDTGQLTKLMKAFQSSLITDLDEDSFADMYAQTIAYGLLSARITDPSKKTVDDFTDHMRTSPFLCELMQTFLRIGGRKGRAGVSGIDFDELGVGDVIQLLDRANIEAVLRDFGDRNRQEDPVMHFFEGFLHAYDSKIRKDRGVFYTPQPVVSYIVQGIHDLLKTEFGLEDGLADITTWGEMIERFPDLKLPVLSSGSELELCVSLNEPFVQILDPATGTATFVVEVIDLIHRTLNEKWDQAGFTKDQKRKAWNDYVPKFLLTRIYAYELMMAPYAIAHMKVGLKLSETGYEFKASERAHIYLTNALKPWMKQLPLVGLEALAHEAMAVNRVKKEKRFTVILGNPPYSLYSSNMTPESRQLIDEYRSIEGVKVVERGALQLEKNLQDDYVKFFAFSERLILDSSIGILAFISNHGYLGNKSLRGMRYHLLKSFNKAWILNLHGSVSRAKYGDEKDQNVFDIVQGVAIGIYCAPPIKKIPEVMYQDIYGLRPYKYKYLQAGRLSAHNWTSVVPKRSEYFFIPFDDNLRKEYELGFPLDKIMPVNSSGMVTARDGITIWLDKNSFESFLKKFVQLSADDARSEYKLGEDTKDWSVERAQIDVKSNKFAACITQVEYRPFDYRWTFYTGQARGFICNPRRPVLQHVRAFKNISLVVNRQVNNEFRHALVSRSLIDTCTLSSATRETAYIFPLELSVEGDLSLLDSVKHFNFSEDFLKAFNNAISNTKLSQISPESIFAYIYSILYSNSYRSRYAEFLRIDFPRIPLPADMKLFSKLTEFGERLIKLHLLDEYQIADSQILYTGKENTQVEKATHSLNTIWLDKAQASGFVGVDEKIWNYHIGGYQVCQKWLKDRKGTFLSMDDIKHYQKIIISLGETIEIAEKIDDAINIHGGWPNAFCQK
jgi:predicted helicase